MGRKSREEAANTRAQVVRAASALFREQGLAVSVGEVMAAVGLTHGGFYKHFGDKDSLAAEALERASLETTAHLEERAARSASTPLAGVVQAYLSREHAEHRGAGCPIAALAPEASRQPRLRATLTEAVRRLGHVVEASRPSGDADGGTLPTWGVVAALVGAVVLARAVDDPSLASKIRAETKRMLLTRLGPRGEESR